MTDIDHLIRDHALRLAHLANTTDIENNIMISSLDKHVLAAANEHVCRSTNDLVDAIEAEMRNFYRLCESEPVDAEAIAFANISDHVQGITATLSKICPDIADHDILAMLINKRIFEGITSAVALTQTESSWHGSLACDCFISAHALDNIDGRFPKAPEVPDEDEMLAACKAANNIDTAAVASAEALFANHPVKLMQDLIASGELDARNEPDEDPLYDYKPHRADVLRTAITYTCGYCGLDDDEIDKIAALCMDTDWYYRHKSADELDMQIGRAIEHAEQLIDLGMTEDSDIERIRELTGLDAETIEQLINAYRLEN